MSYREKWNEFYWDAREMGATEEESMAYANEKEADWLAKQADDAYERSREQPRSQRVGDEVI